MGEPGAVDLHDAKAWLKNSLGGSDGLLHVTIGLAMFLTIAALLRRRRHGALVAFVAVAVAQALNELLDAQISLYWKQSVDWAEAIRDSALTLALPAALLILRGARAHARRAS